MQTADKLSQPIQAEWKRSKCKFNNFITHTCSMKHLFMIYLDKRVQAYTYACMISALPFS